MLSQSFHRRHQAIWRTRPRPPALSLPPRISHGDPSNAPPLTLTSSSCVSFMRFLVWLDSLSISPCRRGGTGEADVKTGSWANSSEKRSDDDESSIVNLKDAEEEEAEVFEHLGKKVPEEADVGRQVGDGEAEDKSGGGSSYSGHHLEHWNQHFTRQDFRQATCAKVHTNFNSRTVRTPDLTPFPLGLCLVFNDGFFF